MDPSGQEYSKSDTVERLYRTNVASDLLTFRIVVGESDLWVLASQDIKSEAMLELKKYRCQLKEYIHLHPNFAVALEPYPLDPAAPKIVQWMIESSAKAGVGPMAAVAGAIAGMIGSRFRDQSAEVIIENGGDIYLHTLKERIISIFAGDSVFSLKIGLQLPPQPAGLGICTSAGTVGPSLSLGKADAAVILAPDVALADAAATAVANRIQNEADLSKAVAFARTISGVIGVLVIKNDKMAAWGEVELVPIHN